MSKVILDPNRPSVLQTTGEFTLFNAISCDKAREVFNQRQHQGQFGLMQLKDHMINKGIKHQEGCPALEPGALVELDKLLNGD